MPDGSGLIERHKVRQFGGGLRGSLSGGWSGAAFKGMPERFKLRGQAAESVPQDASGGVGLDLVKHVKPTSLDVEFRVLDPSAVGREMKNAKSQGPVIQILNSTVSRA